MFCMFYMVYHLYISNAPAPKTVHSKSNTTTKLAAPNFMRVFYHKFPPSAYPPTTGGRSREIRLSRSDQVARRATRGALRSKVARGRAGAMRGANPPRVRYSAAYPTGAERSAKKTFYYGLISIEASDLR